MISATETAKKESLKYYIDRDFFLADIVVLADIWPFSPSVKTALFYPEDEVILWNQFASVYIY